MVITHTPESDLSLRVILSVLGALNRSSECASLNLSLVQVKLPSMTNLHRRVRCIVALHSLGVVIVLAGPPGQPRTSSPVCLYIVGLIVLKLGRKLCVGLVGTALN